jgi:hypothetical protein
VCVCVRVCVSVRVSVQVRMCVCVCVQVLHALSSKRILTMTFEDGVQVNDLAGLEQMGADKKEVGVK